MTLTLQLDLEEEGRDGMYEKLCEMFGEDEVDKTLENQCIQHITQMFDQREELKKMEEQHGDI